MRRQTSHSSQMRFGGALGAARPSRNRGSRSRCRAVGIDACSNNVEKPRARVCLLFNSDLALPMLACRRNKCSNLGKHVTAGETKSKAQ
eukprot:7380352-Prymnesium_polylepis.2